MPLSVSRYLIKLVNIEVANVDKVDNKFSNYRGLIIDERSRSAT